MTPCTVAYQVSPSTGFSRQECWSGLPFPSPRLPLLRPYFHIRSHSEVLGSMSSTNLFWRGHNSTKNRGRDSSLWLRLYQYLLNQTDVLWHVLEKSGRKKDKRKSLRKSAHNTQLPEDSSHAFPKHWQVLLKNLFNSKLPRLFNYQTLQLQLWKEVKDRWKEKHRAGKWENH